MLRQEASTLRAKRQQRVFKADLRTSPYCVRWEVLRPPVPGRDPELLFQLRKVVRGIQGSAHELQKAHPSSVSGASPSAGSKGGIAQHGPNPAVSSGHATSPLVAIGLRSVTNAVQRGTALCVLVCAGEGISSCLVQHLPVMCSLRSVPIAILAASPHALGEALAPLGRVHKAAGHSENAAAKRAFAASAVALLQPGCNNWPELLAFVKTVRQTAPKVKVPFLIPTAGLPQCAPLRLRRRRRAPPAAVDSSADGKGSADGVGVCGIDAPAAAARLSSAHKAPAPKRPQAPFGNSVGPAPSRQAKRARCNPDAMDAKADAMSRRSVKEPQCTGKSAIAVDVAPTSAPNDNAGDTTANASQTGTVQKSGVCAESKGGGPSIYDFFDDVVS